MPTDRSFPNMTNQMPVVKKPLKEKKPAKNPWAAMLKMK